MPMNKYFTVDDRLRGRFWRRFGSFEFARNASGTTIEATEASAVASYAPIVFTKRASGLSPYMPFSTCDAENAFVSKTGEWLGCYVPARLRSYPFCFLGRRGDETLAVCQDAVISDQFADRHCVPFFSSDGQLSEPVRAIEGFLSKLKAERSRTDLMMKKIARLDILVKLRIDDFTGMSGKPFFRIDWKRLTKNKAIQGALARDIELQRLLHAHEVSLHQFARLRALEACGSRDRHTLVAEGPDRNEFLEALSDALQEL